MTAFLLPSLLAPYLVHAQPSGYGDTDGGSGGFGGGGYDGGPGGYGGGPGVSSGGGSSNSTGPSNYGGGPSGGGYGGGDSYNYYGGEGPGDTNFGGGYSPPSYSPAAVTEAAISAAGSIGSSGGYDPAADYGGDPGGEFGGLGSDFSGGAGTEFGGYGPNISDSTTYGGRDLSVALGAGVQAQTPTVSVDPLGPTYSGPKGVVGPLSVPNPFDETGTYKTASLNEAARAAAANYAGLSKDTVDTGEIPSQQPATFTGDTSFSLNADGTYTGDFTGDNYYSVDIPGSAAVDDAIARSGFNANDVEVTVDLSKGFDSTVEVTERSSGRTTTFAMEDDLGITPSFPSSQQLGETYSGPKGVTDLNDAARLSAVTYAGYVVPGIAFTNDDIDLIARLAVAEAGTIDNAQGNVQVDALLAVIDTVRNRVLSTGFPSTINAVINQNYKGTYQFEPVKNGSINSINRNGSAYQAARSMVADVLNGTAVPTAVTADGRGMVNFGNLGVIASRGPEITSQQTKNNFSVMGQDPNSITFTSVSNPGQSHTHGIIGSPNVPNFGAYSTGFNLGSRSTPPSNITDISIPDITTVPTPTSRSDALADGSTTSFDPDALSDQQRSNYDKAIAEATQAKADLEAAKEQAQNAAIDSERMFAYAAALDRYDSMQLALDVMENALQNNNEVQAVASLGDIVSLSNDINTVAESISPTADTSAGSGIDNVLTEGLEICNCTRVELTTALSRPNAINDTYKETQNLALSSLTDKYGKITVTIFSGTHVHPEFDPAKLSEQDRADYEAGRVSKESLLADGKGIPSGRHAHGNGGDTIYSISGQGSISANKSYTTTDGRTVSGVEVLGDIAAALSSASGGNVGIGLSHKSGQITHVDFEPNSSNGAWTYSQSYANSATKEAFNTIFAAISANKDVSITGGNTISGFLDSPEYSSLFSDNTTPQNAAEAAEQAAFDAAQSAVNVPATSVDRAVANGIAEQAIAKANEAAQAFNNGQVTEAEALAKEAEELAMRTEETAKNAAPAGSEPVNTQVASERTGSVAATRSGGSSAGSQIAAIVSDIFEGDGPIIKKYPKTNLSSNPVVTLFGFNGLNALQNLNDLFSAADEPKYTEQNILELLNNLQMEQKITAEEQAEILDAVRRAYEKAIVNAGQINLNDDVQDDNNDSLLVGGGIISESADRIGDFVGDWLASAGIINPSDPIDDRKMVELTELDGDSDLEKVLDKLVSKGSINEQESNNIITSTKATLRKDIEIAQRKEDAIVSGQAVPTVYVPVTVTVDTRSKTMELSREDLIEELRVLEAISGEIGDSEEYQALVDNEPSIVFDENGEIVYSDGLYAPPTVYGNELLEDNRNYEYAYFIRYLDENGEYETFDSDESFSESGIANFIRSLNGQNTLITIYDVDNVFYRLIDPKEFVRGDEYYDYAIRLKDGSTRTIAIPEFTSISFMREQFSEIGYEGDVIQLINQGQEVVHNESDLNLFARGINTLTDKINQLIGGITGNQNSDEDFEYTELPTPPENSLANLLIDYELNSVYLYPNAGETCQNVPGLNDSFVYTVLFVNKSNSNDVATFTEQACGTDNTIAQFGEVASRIESITDEDFANFQEFTDVTYYDQSVTEFTPGLAFGNIDSIFGETNTEETSTPTNEVPDEQEDFIPNTTNNVTFEVKALDRDGQVLADWVYGDIEINEAVELHFRWDGTEYSQCLPFLADNGSYALSRGGDTSMITGNTESEGFDITERSGIYRIECGGQINGEFGVDEREIQVTIN